MERCRELPPSDRIMVGDLVLIELFGWELSYAGMHSVLDLEHSPIVSAQKQSLEERAAEIGFGRVGTERSCWKLVLITNEDDSLRLQLKRNES